MSEPVGEHARGRAGLVAYLPARDALRRAITAATLAPETDCLPPLIEAAALSSEQSSEAMTLARELVETLRAIGAADGIEGLIQEYDLSSDEGVALMCLAEALLRIPDHETRDALIRDKIGGGDWRSHLGHSPSLFVNAATWGLVVTGRLTATANETSLGSALRRLVGRGGEPLIRAGVDLAMRLLGEQFVMGRTIGEALRRSRAMERKGLRYSYDMLGEAAMTQADADRYFEAYRAAIEAVGQASGGRGPIEGPGVSIKLSALHPRYSRSQRRRAIDELLPRLIELAMLARRFDIGVNVDAEESDRLELSLDLFEALRRDQKLAGWDGLGFVVQSYGKRAPFVVDWLIDLARRTRRRLMLRLVKGAYWDGEIKRAQALGLADFPVFTRKIHTDVSYLACARRMLEAGPTLFPQFATHNAMTLAAVRAMAGDRPGTTYEFQCLHGMGEPLYEAAIETGIGVPCRIYAPVGGHETLLAYLVRRLLENGANSSFVNRIADETVGVEDLLADPVEEARALSPIGAPHPKIAAPRSLFAPSRANSAGYELSDEAPLERLGAAMASSADRRWSAAPAERSTGEGRPVLNPANRSDCVGRVVEATAEDVAAALARAAEGAARWGTTEPSDRAAMLERAADLLERRGPELFGLIIREAGKTLPNAASEVREAIDFLRYYAAEIRAGWSAGTHRPLGPVACISPWNFPLAIFVGQVAAALAAGDVVLAKPAEETPLIAAAAVAILHEAGVPDHALQLLPGDGRIGAALVGGARVAGVTFTGSTEVARLIQKQLALRLGPSGDPIPLIAETGGQNAMIVDSSALPEQAVADVLASAFDSAGQRCSALRLLCVQDDVADKVLSMLEGAMAELAIGDPAKLSTDVGPVIKDEARASIETHVAAMRRLGRRVVAAPLPRECAAGSFVAPTLIELSGVEELGREVFGPVLHVLRYRRDDLADLLDRIAAVGHGLTFGLHTRIDETIERVLARAQAGNLYVNRNMVGAVVGSQPFGGHGLSGTGPKAGGPLYLRRLLSAAPPFSAIAGKAPQAAGAFCDWLDAEGRSDLAARCRSLAARSPLGGVAILPGPVGEKNSYELRARRAMLCRAREEAALLVQIGVALAVGAVALVDAPPQVESALARLPAELAKWVRIARLAPDVAFSAALVEPDTDEAAALLRAMAARPGPIVPVHVVAAPGGDEAIRLELLVEERSVSVNTAAAGGNASLMALQP